MELDMSEVSRFAPPILIHGITVEPEGWMWVLGFALGGVQWAINEVSDPAFDLDGKVLNYRRRKDDYFARIEIDDLEQRIETLRGRLLTPSGGVVQDKIGRTS